MAAPEGDATFQGRIDGAPSAHHILRECGYHYGAEEGGKESGLQSVLNHCSLALRMDGGKDGRRCKLIFHPCCLSAKLLGSKHLLGSPG